jgi:hypothetical protein
MRAIRLGLFGVLYLYSFPIMATPLSAGGGVPGVDPGQFRITAFITGQSFATSVAGAPGGGVLVASGATAGVVRRFTDANADGVADGAGVDVIQLAQGAVIASMVSAGSLVAVGVIGQGVHFFAAGANPNAPYTDLGMIGLAFPPGYSHNTPGLAIRPSLTTPGSYEVFFSAGSPTNTGVSGALTLGGLASGTLNPQSIYSTTITLAANTLSITTPRQVAAGLRNAVGIGFRPGTGDLYFGENGIDGLVNPHEPESADELNVIQAALLNTSIVDFGYPNHYTQYRTGADIGSGGTLPLVAFQPLGNPLTGAESEGVIGLAFSPPGFPGQLSNGVFLSFNGRFGSGDGLDNEENPVLYYDFTTGQYYEFISNSEPGVYLPTGLWASGDSLFMADLYGQGGAVYQITAIQQTPEPSGWLMLAVGLLVAGRVCGMGRISVPAERGSGVG